MTEDDKTADPKTEELKDEALDDAQGGFFMSRSFTKTFTANTVVKDPNFLTAETETAEIKDLDVDEAALRPRPGRIGNPFGG